MAHLLVLLLSFVVLSSLDTASPSPAIKGFSLELIDRYSIHYPLFPRNLTTIERIRRQAELNEARLRWLKSSIAGSHSMSISPAVSYEKSRYLTALGIGTPQTSLHLLLDTGSEITWTQSHPCRQCFPQTLPVFKPGSSITYRPLSCRDPLCVPRICDDHGLCEFNIRYHSQTGPHTKGNLAIEDFTVGSTSGGSDIIKNVVFGSSVETTEDIFDDIESIDGILGLGGGPLSLVTQLGNRIQHRFSHCLLAYDQPGFSYLRFGNDIRVGSNAQSTPLVPNPHQVYYYVNMIDISINGVRLNLPSKTFSATGGCMIDTGSPFSNLITTAYNAVVRVLSDYFSKYHLRRIDGHSYQLSLCYSMPKGFDDFPTMAFHFQGADLQLEKQNLFFIDYGKWAFCLTMLPDSITVLGSAQMGNIQFIYDVGARVLTFAPQNCARN